MQCVRVYKCRAFEYVQSYYQLKIDCLKYKICYVNLIVTTNQTPTVHTKNIKRKESKHTPTESYQITKEENKGRRKKQWNYNQKRKLLTKWQR